VKNIDVLIVVDTVAALAASDLQSNVYLIDTNKHLGSGAEGQAELITACTDGQIIKWRVTGVSDGNEVNIVAFTGEIITKKICNPLKQGMAGAIFWEGRVESQGAAAKYQYSLELAIDGHQLTFDPFLQVSPS
jgi:hypothetical protein